jgi:hypothetical protein
VRVGKTDMSDMELEIPTAVEATAKNGWTTFDRSMGGSDKDGFY